MLSLSLNLSAVNSPTVKDGTLSAPLPSMLDCWWVHPFTKTVQISKMICHQLWLQWPSCSRDDILYSVLFFTIPWPFTAIIWSKTTAEESIGLREEWLLLSEQAVSRCSYTNRHMLYPALKSHKFLFPEIVVHAKIHGCKNKQQTGLSPKLVFILLFLHAILENGCWHYQLNTLLLYKSLI